jgi:hypothetical protein
LTNFINNVVSSNKGILIADACIYICTTVCKFSQYTPPIKQDSHDITEILLKVALNTIITPI